MQIQRYDGRRDLTRAPDAVEPTIFAASAAAPREDLQRYLRALLRRWWLIAGFAAVALAGAWWTERNAVPRYTARALLQMRSDQPVLPVGMVGVQRNEGFESHVEIIRSRAVSLPAVQSLGLQLRFDERTSRRTRLLDFVEVEQTAPRGHYSLQSRGEQLVLHDLRNNEELGSFASADTVVGPGFSLVPSDPWRFATPVPFRILDIERATGLLQRQLRIQPGLGPDLIWVRFSHHDRQHAADVVNAVASSYRRYRASLAGEMAVRRRQVIAEELVQLADSLEHVQDALLQYQSSQGMLNPQTEPQALVSERLTREAEIRDYQFKERMLRTLVAELETTGPNDALQQRLLALGSDVIPGGIALQSRLEQLEDERDRLTASRFGLTANAPEVQTLDSLIASTKRQMQIAANESLELLEERISEAQSRLGQVRAGVSAAPQETAEFERLQQRVLAVQGIYDVMVTEYYQAQIAEGIEAGDVTIVDPAAVPLWPDPSRKRLKFGMALLAGLLMGAVGALTLEQFDKSITSQQHAERVTQVPVLGTVPRIRSTAPDSADMRIGKEAFRTLRTNLKFALPTPPKSLAITSAEPGEGKSTVSSNLALALAEQGLRVVIVDADLRRPRIHQIFNVPKEPGLAEILRGDAGIENAVVPHPTAKSLHILPGGNASDHASELIGGPAFDRFLSELQDRYDIVVVDTAPVLAFTDAQLVSVIADGTVLVARARKTAEDKLVEAVASLRQVNSQLLGIVLNATPISGASTYYYEYYDQADGGRGLTVDRARPSRGSERRRSTGRSA